MLKYFVDQVHERSKPRRAAVDSHVPHIVEADSVKTKVGRRRRKTMRERHAPPTLWSAALITHTSARSSSCYKSFPPKDPHPTFTYLLSLSLPLSPLTRSGKKWTNDHSISPANALHFFVTSISESVNFLQGDDGTQNYVTGWLHRRGHPYSHGGVNRCNSSSIEREPCLNNFLNQHRTLSCPLKSPTTSHGKLRRCNGFSVDFPQLTNLRGKHHTTQVASTQPDRPHMTRDESEGKREPRAALARAVRN